MVVLPSLRHSRGAHLVAQGVGQVVNPTKRLRELEGNLQLSNTVANKLALADELLASGQPERAEALYRDCLQGIFRGDRNISLKQARALAGMARYPEAVAVLRPLAAQAPLERVEDQLLLRLCEEQIGAGADAVLAGLRRLFATARNLETGYHLCRCQQAAGQGEAARQTVAEMEALLHHHKHFRSTMGRQWVREAQKLL